jgi:hypothetical protein
MKPLIRALAVLCFAAIFCANALAQTPERYLVLEGTTALAHVYNVSDNTEVAAVKVGNTPTGAVITGGGRLAVVANLNSNYLSVIDLTLKAEIKRLRGIRFGLMAVSADGSTIIGADIDDQKLKLIDAASFNLTQAFNLNGKFGDDPNNPFDLSLAFPVILGNQVYLNTNFAVGAVDLTSGAVTLISTPTTGRNVFTHNIAATLDGKFVAAARAGSLLVIDPTANTVVQTFPGFFSSVVASHNPATPELVYVVRLTAAGLVFSSLDLSTGQFLTDVPLPAGFTDARTDIGLNADESKAYIAASATSPDFAVIDNTTHSIVTQFSVGVRAAIGASGPIQLQPVPGAPLVTSVSPGLVVNNAPATIQISGSGFASDAQVRIGSLDPISAQVTSSSQLQVTVPANSAAQGAPIIVTNPDLAQGPPGAQQSGILRNAFIIASAPTFQPANQVLVPNFADSTMSVLNVSTNTTLAPAIPTGSRPMGIAILPDGSRAFVEDLFSPPAIDVYNFTTNTIESHIVLSPANSGLPGQTRGIVLAPLFGTTHLAAYVDVARPVAGGFTVDVDVIDADPTSPTFATVLQAIPSGAPNPTAAQGAMAVTPDGHYAFIQTFERGLPQDVDLITLDLTTGASTSVRGSTLGFSGFQPNLELSADGNFMVVALDVGTLGILYVSSPFSPKFIRSVGNLPPGTFLLPRVVGSRLYGFDPSRNFVDIFNFNPAANDFAEQGSFSFTASTHSFGITFDATADGKLLYLPLREEDAVAVVDINKVIATQGTDPSALVAKIGTGISPNSLAVRPGTPTPAGTNVAVQPVPQVSLTYSTVSTSGATTVTTTNTNPDPLPAGFSLGTPPIYYEISTTAVFTSTVQVCISYNPAQFTGPESNIRLLHDENGVFVDITTSLDTVNHIVCGQATHFSAFTVGIASVDFFFNTLLREVNSGVTDPGERQSLAAKVQAAKASFDAGDSASAANQLNAFENEVRAQSGRKLSAAEAARLVQLADTILARL